LGYGHSLGHGRPALIRAFAAPYKSGSISTILRLSDAAIRQRATAASQPARFARCETHKPDRESFRSGARRVRGGSPAPGVPA